MHYVYTLQLKNGTLYVGQTGNLKRRIGEHKDNKVRSTRHRDCKLVFYESFLSKDDAIRREVYFKSSKGKSTLRMMLQKSLNCYSIEK
jgi:putative endonuclease